MRSVLSMDTKKDRFDTSVYQTGPRKLTKGFYHNDEG